MHHLRENLSFIFAYSPIESFCHFEKKKIITRIDTILHNYLKSHRDNTYEKCHLFLRFHQLRKAK